MSDNTPFPEINGPMQLLVNAGNFSVHLDPGWKDGIIFADDATPREKFDSLRLHTVALCTPEVPPRIIAVSPDVEICPGTHLLHPPHQGLHFHFSVKSQRHVIFDALGGGDAGPVGFSS